LAANGFGRQACRSLLYTIAFTSYGNFNPALFGAATAPTPGDYTSPQHIVILGLWVILIACSFLPGATVLSPRTRGLFWPASLLCYATISPAWSDDPFSAAPKAGAFLICSIGIWRLVSMFSVREVLEIVTRTFALLVAVSAVALVVDPGHAISHEWRFETNQFEHLWQGVFDSKQTLGFVGADFTFLMLMRTLNRRSFVASLGVLLGLILVIGSGSRGGAVEATIVPVAIITARRYPRLFPMIVNVIPVVLTLAIAAILYLAITGYDYIYILGNETDFSQRTFIWQYAIGLWQSRPLFGFGLNGFWTNPQILWGFLRIHGWVLDNYHSGYLAILVETGLIGMSLFCTMVWKICSRLRLMLRSGSTETLELALGLMLMTFMINLTETTFLRSANFGEVLFCFLLVNVLSPVPLSRKQRVAEQDTRWRPGYV
jgi:O-antigen ligase